MGIKEKVKSLIKRIPVAFTQNQRYDRQTVKVIRKVALSGRNFIDVGCHKGEIMDLYLKYAPDGIHYGFEPIPAMKQALDRKFSGNTNVVISSIALSDREGSSTFNFVISNPAYSGLVKRKYDHQGEKDTSITVQVGRLDDFLPAGFVPHLIKIDVEGGELQVFKGAIQTLKKYKPVVIFEHGLGASDCYGSTPEKVYTLLTECGLKISLMKYWLKGKPGLNSEEFSQQYYEKKNYYFIAYP